MADKIYKDKIGQGIDQVTPPATQADHVPQFGQVQPLLAYTPADDAVVAIKLVPDNGETVGANNAKTNNEYAILNPDLKTCIIAHGGHINFPNIIGSFNGTGAHYSIISGGYDNIVDVIAGTISGGAHHRLNGDEPNSSHNTIGGGAEHEIQRGEFSGIFAGTRNKLFKIESDLTTPNIPSYCFIGGGEANEIRSSSSVITGGRQNKINKANSVISGGLLNISEGDGSVISGGSFNSAKGNWAVISGGFTNQIIKADGSKNSIGGGGDNIIDGAGIVENNVISGGRYNEILGKYNAVLGGQSNKIGVTGTDSQYSNIQGGMLNAINNGALFAVISGGRENNATASYSSISGGRGNKASGQYARANGLDADARYKAGETISSGKIAVQGDAQTSVIVSKVVSISDAFASFDTLNLPDNSTFMFEVNIVGRSVGVQDESSAFKITGCIDRNTGAGTTALVGTPNVVLFASDISTRDVRVLANTTAGGLQLQAKGEAAKNVAWVARITLTEVTA